jgi:hypothetical protein
MASKFDKVRESVMEKVGELFEKMEYDVLRTGSQELCIPIIGEDNEEGYLVVTFKVPKGSRDGDVYDGYVMAEDYKMRCEAKVENKKEADKKKAAKIMKDEEMRRQKAGIKAKRKAGG